MQHYRRIMNYKYVPKSIKNAEPKIEFSWEYGHRTTVIKYPKPNPKDRIEDEYDNTPNE